MAPPDRYADPGPIDLPLVKHAAIGVTIRIRVTCDGEEPVVPRDRDPDPEPTDN